MSDNFTGISLNLDIRQAGNSIGHRAGEPALIDLRLWPKGCNHKYISDPAVKASPLTPPGPWPQLTKRSASRTPL
jgi:hypothetical protein